MSALWLSIHVSTEGVILPRIATRGTLTGMMISLIDEKHSTMSLLLRIAIAIPLAIFACYVTIVFLAFALMAPFLLLPIMFVGVIVGATSGVLVVRWRPRFSFRTMLIATTLVAVVLGLVVWMASK